MKSTFKNTFTFAVLLTFIGLLFTPGFTLGQNEAGAKIDNKEKQQVIDSIMLFMADYYVFPDVGKEMGDYLQKRLKTGEYDKINDYMEFGATLSEDLQSVSNDKHIGVRYAPEMIAMINKAEEDENNKELEDLEKRQAEYSNYNFKEIKVLPGNIGYLKFNSFMHASESGATAVAAMNFLAHTDALIIDLRDNGGGSPSLIQLITSYFFEGVEHLNSFYIREGDQTHQFWTLPYAPGPKMLDTELFILTSSGTFSGAEEFTYNLKNMERATVVGETTGGGAHPVSRYLINDNYMVSVPFGRAINPITNSNWEGTGIEPDVKTSRAEAFDKAYLLALEKLMEKEKDNNILSELNWAYDGLNATLNPVVIDESTLKKYTGDYGPRKITLEDGQLYYQRENRPKMQMIPMNENTFMFNEINYFRLKFIITNGKATAIEGHYDSGRKDKNSRT